MRLAFTALALVSLGACAQVPDSAAGVGFNNSLNDERARQAILAQQAPAPSPVPTGAISAETTAARVPVQTVASGTLPAPASVASAQSLGPAPSAQPATQQDAILEAAASLDQTQANSGIAPVQASPANPAPQIVNNPGISDENDFQAVSLRETIQSDAQRIEQNRAQYQVVQPTVVPSRDGVSQPNIVQYALETRHPKGVRVYSRVGLNLTARSRRHCAEFASADLAQIEFLANGGPRRDRQSLDPDGDGYACGWDPAPFRTAVQN